jgi:uncharacterized DUF497 family protein
MQYSYIQKLLGRDRRIGYGATVEIEFDPAKDAANLEKHGVSLARTGQLEIIAVTEKSRPEERERRFRIYGLLDGKAYCAVLTWRDGTARAISLRKANRMERKRHEVQGRD